MAFGLGGTIRELVVSVVVKYNQGGFSIVENRLETIRQIMDGIVNSSAKLANVVVDFAKSGANLESMEIKFGTLAKSMELGKAKLEELNEFAATTPFTLPEVRKNTAMLMAMGIELQNVIPTMTMLGNVTAGLPNLSLERLALNFGQVRSQGYLTGRELRDFAVGGVPIIEALSELTGKTDNQLREMIKNKQVSFDLVNKAFEYMVSNEGRFYKLLDKMAESSEGLYNNIKVTWDLIKEGVGKELLENLKPILKEIKDFFFTNREEIVKRLSTLMTKLAKIMVKLYKILYKLGSVFLPLVEFLADLVLGYYEAKVATLEYITTNKTLIKVLKTLIFVTGVFLGGLVVHKLLTYINKLGGLRMALWGVAKAAWAAIPAMKKFGLILLASMKKVLVAAAPALAIGAFIASVILLLQDFYTYFWGKATGTKTETVIGRALDGLMKKFPTLAKRLESMLEIVVGPLRAVVLIIKAFWKWLNGESFDELLADDKMFNNFLKKFEDMVNEAKKMWNELWELPGLKQTSTFFTKTGTHKGGITGTGMLLDFGNMISGDRVQQLREDVNAANASLQTSIDQKVEVNTTNQFNGVTQDQAERYMSISQEDSAAAAAELVSKMGDSGE